jgi:hypothetical protein
LAPDLLGCANVSAVQADDDRGLARRIDVDTAVHFAGVLFAPPDGSAEASTRWFGH